MPNDPTNAPELTREQVQAILVRPLEARSVFLASGPRVFDVTHSGRVRIPRLTGMTAPGWHGEGEQITEAEASLDDVILLDGVASLKVITRYSNEMARSSIVALDSALRDKLVTDVQAVLDTALFAGDGVENPSNGLRAPLGIINYPGAQTLPGVGAINPDAILDAVGVLLATNVDPTKARIFMRSNLFIAVRKLKDTQGRYLMQPDPTADGVYRIHGVQVVIVNRLPEVAGASTVSRRRHVAGGRRPRHGAERDPAARALRRHRRAGHPGRGPLRRGAAEPRGRRAARRRHGCLMALVEPEALSAYLTKQGAPPRAVTVADEAAATASTYVEAYCSRLTPGEPAPRVVAAVALHLAARIASNPRSIRSVSTAGQSADLPVLGLTFLESMLLNPYRRTA